MYRYRVIAECASVTTERWTVSSDRPLTQGELILALMDEQEPPGAHIEVACADEDTSEKTVRRITDIEVLP